MPPVDEEAEAKQKLWQAVNFRGAVETGDAVTVENMLTDGFIPTYKMTDGSNWTVLMIAAYSGQEGLTEKFAKGGGKLPKIDETDPCGFQALMLSALKGHTKICQLLLEKKAGVNVRDTSGETPLMKAAAEGHLEVVKLLLEAGADPDMEDCNNMSAIKKAASWGRVECLKELLPKVKDDPRQLKHCLLFGRLNAHEQVVAEMTKVLEPATAEESAVVVRGYNLGDRVQVKSEDPDPWVSGTVVAVEPILKVKRDDMQSGGRWNMVRLEPQETEEAAEAVEPAPAVAT
eukprot:TRINITY_DN11403_c0_g1_i1.p1 TRINITY_DN11403_c0_g1~~TRINITY_DN11403_c0_g1_i1.p1  ORF type:complete len:288 (+),score=58.41 TRINITY_DN11403_c0_g1_i1:103-966(+)